MEMTFPVLRDFHPTPSACRLSVPVLSSRWPSLPPRTMLPNWQNNHRSAGKQKGGDENRPKQRQQADSSGQQAESADIAVRQRAYPVAVRSAWRRSWFGHRALRCSRSLRALCERKRGRAEAAPRAAAEDALPRGGSALRRRSQQRIGILCVCLGSCLAAWSERENPARRFHPL